MLCTHSMYCESHQKSRNCMRHTIVVTTSAVADQIRAPLVKKKKKKTHCKPQKLVRNQKNRSEVPLSNLNACPTQTLRWLSSSTRTFFSQFVSVFGLHEPTLPYAVKVHIHTKITIENQPQIHTTDTQKKNIYIYIHTKNKPPAANKSNDRTRLIFCQLHNVYVYGKNNTRIRYTSMYVFYYLTQCSTPLLLPPPTTRLSQTFQVNFKSLSLKKKDKQTHARVHCSSSYKRAANLWRFSRKKIYVYYTIWIERIFKTNKRYPKI